MRLLPVSAAVLLCLAGCATGGSDNELTLTKAAVLPAGAALARLRPGLIPGKTTKADVLAALGKTTAIAFDSGYEIWVYHVKDEARRDERPAEFVVLFDPSGVLAKTRTRPAPAPRG